MTCEPGEAAVIAAHRDALAISARSIESALGEDFLRGVGAQAEGETVVCDDTPALFVDRADRGVIEPVGREVEIVAEVSDVAFGQPRKVGARGALDKEHEASAPRVL